MVGLGCLGQGAKREIYIYTYISIEEVTPTLWADWHVGEWEMTYCREGLTLHSSLCFPHSHIPPFILEVGALLFLFINFSSSKHHVGGKSTRSSFFNATCKQGTWRVVNSLWSRYHGKIRERKRLYNLIHKTSPSNIFNNLMHNNKMCKVQQFSLQPLHNIYCFYVPLLFSFIIISTSFSCSFQ